MHVILRDAVYLAILLMLFLLIFNNYQSCPSTIDNDHFSSLNISSNHLYEYFPFSIHLHFSGTSCEYHGHLCFQALYHLSTEGKNI